MEEPDERLDQGNPHVYDGEISSAEIDPEIRTTLAAKRSHGDELTAISDGLVALLKEFYGRGPTQAKSYYQDDLVVCILRGGYTQVEQTLRDGGRGSAVIEQRMQFQELMRERFEAVIEAATGRQRDRIHERQPAGPGPDVRGLRAGPHRPRLSRGDHSKEGEMQSWDLKGLDVPAHQPEILFSAGDARAILLQLPAGEGLQEHQVHERAPSPPTPIPAR